MEFSKMYVDSVFSKALSVRPIFAHSALTHSDVDAAMIVERDWVFRLQSSTLVDTLRHGMDTASLPMHTSHHDSCCLLFENLVSVFVCASYIPAVERALKCWPFE